MFIEVEEVKPKLPTGSARLNEEMDGPPPDGSPTSRARPLDVMSRRQHQPASTWR